MKKHFFTLGIVLLFLFSSALIYADVIFLGPSEFIPVEEGQGYRRSASTGLFMPTTASSGYNDYWAPIHLPDGAKITAVTIFYLDNHIGDIYFRVGRQKQYDNSITPQYIISGNTTEKSANMRYTKFAGVNWTYNTINNAACTYFVQIWLTDTPANSSTLSFHGIKIFYKPPV